MPRFVSPYELDEIAGVLEDRNIPVPNEFQSNFSTVQPFETETIDLDKISPDLRIATFVSADVQAKPTTPRGYETKVFYPGYWKDKTTIDFRNLRARQIGQPLAQPTSNAGKIASAIQANMDIMKAKRTRLLEWVASEILIKGIYTAVSELHPSVTVDMEPNIAQNAVDLNGGRANRANLTSVQVNGWPVITDNGGAGFRAWDSTGGTNPVSPVADIEQMLEAAWEPISKIYISNDAWAKLINDPDIARLLSTQITSLTNFNVDLLPKQQTREGLKFRGTIGAANIPLYSYNATYQPTTAAAGHANEVKFFPDGYVLMVPASQYGIQAYGAIQHADADFTSKEIFWNSWVTEEEGKPWLQGQSAPIFLHTKINSTVCWKVM